MSVPVIPDYVSPIVGYRVWRLYATELESFDGKPWLPDRAFTARCRKTDHESPTDRCSCGVYAAKSYQSLRTIYSSVFIEALVHGEVYLWGKVVEHDLGYRAQFAYPKSFTLSPNGSPSLESLIVYGADIFLPSNILLWTKGSGYTSAGIDYRSSPLICRVCGSSEGCFDWSRDIGNVCLKCRA